MGGRGAVGAACALWLGLTLGVGLDVWGCIVVGGCALLTLALAWRALPRTATVLMGIALALAGAARAGACRRALEVERQRVPETGMLVRLVGTVDQPPLRESGVTTVVMRVEQARPPLVRGSQVRLVLPDGASAEWSDRLRA